MSPTGVTAHSSQPSGWSHPAYPNALINELVNSRERGAKGHHVPFPTHDWCGSTCVDGAVRRKFFPPFRLWVSAVAMVTRRLFHDSDCLEHWLLALQLYSFIFTWCCHSNNLKRFFRGVIVICQSSADQVLLITNLKQELLNVLVSVHRKCRKQTSLRIYPPLLVQTRAAF